MLELRYLHNTEQGDVFSPNRFLILNNENVAAIQNEHFNLNKYNILIKDLIELLNLKLITCNRYTNEHLNCIVYLDARIPKEDPFNEFILDREVNSISLIYTEKFDLEEFIEKLKTLPLKDLSDKGLKVNLVSISNGNPYTVTKYADKKIIIDKENSYNLNFSIDSIIEDIRSEKSGLLLFTGNPGGGKTSLIKYLAQENKDKNFFFIPASNLNILSNPNFVTYCLNEMQNSILIIEDCEKVLLTRDLNKGHDISNILNITDGIAGELLNLKIIATLNTSDNIDNALLRKGRLIKKVDFNPLKEEQVMNLSKFLKLDIKDPREMMLCDIYNLNETGNQKIETKIGFK